MDLINAVPQEKDVEVSAHLQWWSKLDFQDPQDHQDHQDLQDLMVHLVAQAAPVQLEHQEIQEHLEEKDPKAHLDPQDHLERLLKLPQPSSWSALLSKAAQKNVHQVLSKSVDLT